MVFLDLPILLAGVQVYLLGMELDMRDYRLVGKMCSGRRLRRRLDKEEGSPS